MDKERVDLTKKALQAVAEMENSMKMEDIVKDNVIEFKVGEQKYRLCRPTQSDNDKINDYRRKEYTNLVKDSSFLFREQWIKDYKEKGIDIKKMEENVREMQSKAKGFMTRLAIAKTEKDIDMLKNNIIKLRDRQYALSIKITELLSYSIEDQINIKATSYLCYLVLQKQVKEEWVKVFDKLEDFKNSQNHELVNQAIYLVNYLIYNV